MPDGAVIAAATMRAEAARLDVVGANLVNTSTLGYKRQLPGFADLYADFLSHDVAPAYAASTSGLDMRPGPLRNTGNALDVAIEGDAFFELQLKGVSAYTRQGSFTLDAQGRLQTVDGATVQGVAGDIKLESSQPRIDAMGRVFVADAQVGQLKLVRFDQVTRLRALNNGRFLQGDAQPAVGEGAPSRVRQGFLEASNVQLADEMVSLMESARRFESGQRVILWFGEMYDQVRQRLGEF